MPRRIILIGGLLDDIQRDALLARLRSEVSATDEWDWVHSKQIDAFQPSHKAMNRLKDELCQWLAAKKKADSGGPPANPESLVVVKLVDLHGRAAHQLFRVWSEPLLVAKAVRTADRLVEWIGSEESNLFPPREWWAGLTEAALVAILCKLLKNKSWNADVQGHAWTKQEDILTQSPVVRTDSPKISIEARRLLPTLKGRLLLSKGAGQGKTPREWSIDSRFLAAVKCCITTNSLAPLQKFSCLTGILDKVAQEREATYRLDGDIVNQRVVFICRERD